ncbi:hypothetical protein QBC38DRAFT_460555 [Podospora fimiseda]|uniref:Uncharacterized protein n=1 Tax=Podospora fimiseda TaxID=252190 RepID=A0AAN6YN23_9PEZI|nr:hypothetical protein QBC38DRAFT_460555 [Podospora fimiseda]
MDGYCVHVYTRGPGGGPLDLREPGFTSCVTLAGYAVFEVTLWNTLKELVADWNETLGAMNDYLNKISRAKFMYNNFQLDRSEFYFSLLQLLRQFNDTIEGTMQDFSLLSDTARYTLSGVAENVKRHWSISIEPDLVAIESNSCKLEKELTDRASEFSERIPRKTREVESLRDGVSRIYSKPTVVLDVNDHALQRPVRS